MRKFFEFAGFAAGAILVAFGVAVIALGMSGRSTVQDSLKQEQIAGSADMTPALIKEEIAKSGLDIAAPTCSVADKAITNGDSARCFAQYMRIHTLLGTGNQTYAQMGRYATADGKGTSDAAKALKDEKGQPVSNPARELWVTETALSTALNVSYMAEQLSLFSLVIGVALLLTGVGFIVLDWVALHRRRAATNSVREPSVARTTAAAV